MWHRFSDLERSEMSKESNSFNWRIAGLAALAFSTALICWSETWAAAITEVAQKNISPPEVQITGYVDMTSYAPNGVEIIRNALNSINEDNVSIQCVGAPRYRLLVKSSDYITAETILKEAADKAIETVLAAGGEGEFHRELE